MATVNVEEAAERRRPQSPPTEDTIIWKPMKSEQDAQVNQDNKGGKSNHSLSGKSAHKKRKVNDDDDDDYRPSGKPANKKHNAKAKLEKVATPKRIQRPIQSPSHQQQSLAKPTKSIHLSQQMIDRYLKDSKPPEELSTDREIRPEQVFAQACGEVDTKYGDEPAKLRMILTVSDEDNVCHSRTGYHAIYNLGRVKNGRMVYEKVGEIHAWRILKPTPDWIPAFLTGNIVNKKARDAGIHETALCLRAAYETDGKPRSNIKDPGIRQQLANNTIIFINLIHTDDEFAQKGLLTPAFKLYHSLLTMLPEKYACAAERTTCLLIPGRPSGDDGKAWKGTKDEDVELTLLKAYKKRGYGIFGEDVEVRTKPGPCEVIQLTFMGRQLRTDDVKQVTRNEIGQDNVLD